MKKILTLLLFICIFSISIQADTLSKAKSLWQNKQYKAALKIYQKEAKNDNPKALYFLARLYYQKRNFALAEKYLKKASSLGYLKARYNLGVFYQNKSTKYFDLKKSFDIFYALATKDKYASAQNRIGLFLQHGVYVQTDYKLAVKWYEKSAKQGDVDAECNLAFMYASGKGVFPNFGRAHNFAKRGYAQGQEICRKVWKQYNLKNFPEDKSFKIGFFKPID